MEKNTFDHHKPSAAETFVIEETREAYKVLQAHLMSLPSTRERSLALTNLEQSAMWCIKSIVLNGLE